MGTKIWAHRGASGYAPENTIEAFRMAAEMKADGVELDVQLSKDGELVIIHDESLERVSGVVKNVRDLTLAQLKELDVSKPVPGFRTVRIPTLPEVLEELRNTGMTINIECKTGIFFYPGMEEKVVRLIEDMGYTERVWCSSFNHKSVMTIKALCPKVRVGFLVADVLADAAAYAKQYGADALHPSCYHMQEEGLVRRCKANGIAVHLWTVNERADMERFCLAGVDAVITNYPDTAREVVSRL